MDSEKGLRPTEKRPLKATDKSCKKICTLPEFIFRAFFCTVFIAPDYPKNLFYKSLVKRSIGSCLRKMYHF